jgi:2'-5' RNA ligase
MDEDEKRLFFAYEVVAPWSDYYPKANIIDAASRHLTLAFLGNISYSKLKGILNEFPMPPFKVGPVGAFDKCIFLPERHPRLVAWHFQSYEEREELALFQSTIGDWLSKHEYFVDSRPFLAHVTIARQPKNLKHWKDKFVEMPCMIHGIHLYESVGNLVYKPLWSYPIAPAFEEGDHTADIAFLIRGESIKAIHMHAQIALAFKFPSLLSYIRNNPLKNNLDDIIISLNQLICRADCDLGCPLKAVSYHGHLLENDEIFTWEMIVDV